MALLQGNTYKLPVKIDEITNRTIDNIDRGQFIFDNIVKYYGDDGDVIWDAEKECFIVPLTQEDTFSLDRNVSWQVRIKYENGDVDGTKPKIENVYNSITEEVL